MYITCTYITLRSSETSSATLPGVRLISIASRRISESRVASKGIARMPGLIWKRGVATSSASRRFARTSSQRKNAARPTARWTLPMYGDVGRTPPLTNVKRIKHPNTSPVTRFASENSPLSAVQARASSRLPSNISSLPRPVRRARTHLSIVAMKPSFSASARLARVTSSSISARTAFGLNQKPPVVSASSRTIDRTSQAAILT